MRFFFPHGDIWTTKWAVCVCGTRGSFFLPNRKMNHEAAEEFHSLRVCSSIRDLEDYWSPLGTATALPPRGSANKTQLLGKIIARRHQNISDHASTLPALRGFNLPQSCRSPLKKKSLIIRNRTEKKSQSFPPNLLLFHVSLLSTIFHPAAQARNLGSFLTSPLPFSPTLQAPTMSCPV